ncbi:peptidylprolyl isomerase [Thermocrinis jamiesonii]|uniref:peptidylprolyl isomerase n=1 Tax=Thermocrinis jamiesonii TaxID=1302351 RepID=UPI0004952131|nr:peptidylprolyl isomerase [Thermocrinis jamiesonii]
MVGEHIKKVSCGILLFATLVTFSFAGRLFDRVVASVNGEAILESDLKLGMLFYNSANKQEVLSRLLDVWLINQFVQGKGLSVQEEILDQNILRLAQFNNMSLEELQKELETEGLTLKDLKEFLRREMIFSQGIYAILIREVDVSSVELALEKYKAGEVVVKRVVDVITVEKEDGQKVLSILEKTRDFEEIAKLLGLNPERLSVERGMLVDSLDKEVWNAKVGDLVFAEDKDHIYIARVSEIREEYKGKSIEELREEILLKKLEERKKELIENLRKRSFIKVVQ